MKALPPTLLPPLLALNAGFVDTSGFLALQGLFTAHVTGNFVTLGATLVTGTSGTLSKLLALPMFCLVIAAVRLMGYPMLAWRLPELRVLLGLKCLLLIVGAAIALRYGPFVNGDSGSALALGMVLVAAMAIQNAAQRIYLTASPPTTLMTGNTTQLIIDVVDWLHGVPSDKQAATVTRLGRMGLSVVIFAVGCAAGALAYAGLGMACFVLPAVVALVILLVRTTPAQP